MIDDDARDADRSSGSTRLGAAARCSRRRTTDDGLLRPTVIAEAPESARVSCEEVFGPVCVVNACDSLDEAIDARERDRLRPPGGDLHRLDRDRARARPQALEFGGVTINEAPTFRADQMPYGGVKGSGNTKEGPAYTVREMTEERLVVLQA